MRNGWIFALASGGVMLGLGIFVIVLTVALLLVKLLWAWTIPDLFPGAVEQGLVAGAISWFTAFKVAIFLAVLAGVSGARKGRRDD